MCYVQKELSFLTITHSQLNNIINIYNRSKTEEGFTINLNEFDFKLINFTFEQAVAFELYVICQASVGGASMLVSDLYGDATKENNVAIVDGTLFETCLTTASATIKTANSFNIPNQLGTGYILAISIDSTTKAIDVVAKNFVKYVIGSNNSFLTSYPNFADEINAKLA